MIRKPFTITKVTDAEAPQIDENFNRLYQYKLESSKFRNSATFEITPYHRVEYGLAAFSATGSAAVTKVYAFANKFDSILFAGANARHSAVIAMVVDVTQSQISIEIAPISATGVSAATSQSVSVNFVVFGSQP